MVVKIGTASFGGARNRNRKNLTPRYRGVNFKAALGKRESALNDAFFVCSLTSKYPQSKRERVGNDRTLFEQPMRNMGRQNLNSLLDR